MGSPHGGWIRPRPLTCQPRSRKLTYSSCFLQACLWSVLLFSAWTRKQRSKVGERDRKHTHTRVLSLRHWWEHKLRKLEGVFSDTNAIRGPVALKLSFPAPANDPTREMPMSPSLAHTVLAHSALWTLLWALVSFIHTCCLDADICLDSGGTGSPSTAHKAGCRRGLPSSLTE